MKLSDALRGARVTIVKAAELANMHPSHFRRLIRRGIFPKPKRTAKGQPYFDYDLLVCVSKVLRTGIGANGEEVTFYRRRKKTNQPIRSRRNEADPYLKDLASILTQLGYRTHEITPAKLRASLKAAFGEKSPPVEIAVPKLIPYLRT